MRATLSVVRWVFATPLIVVSFALLLALSLAAPVVLMLTHGAVVKSWIAGSGIYQNIAPIAVQLALSKVSATTEGAGQSGDIESLSRGLVTKEELLQDVQELFPPEWLRPQAERAIDGVYAYLHGETNTIVLNLDLASREAKARQLLAKTFKTRLASMPLCATGVGIPNEINIFEDTCIPQGTDLVRINAQIDEGVSKMTAFSKIETITPPSDAYEHTDPLRRVFQWAPWVVLGLFVAMSLLLWLVWGLIPGRTAAYTTLAVLLAISGSVLVVVSLGLKFSFHYLFETYVLDRIPPTDAPPKELFEVLESVFRTAWGSITTVELVLAFLMLGAAYLLWRTRATGILNVWKR